MIKFNKHNVTNKETKKKCRIFYSLDNRLDGRKCVTIYAKGFMDKLSDVFEEGVKNETDTMTDYFEKDRKNFFEGDEFYEQARKMAEKIEIEKNKKYGRA